MRMSRASDPPSPVPSSAPVTRVRRLAGRHGLGVAVAVVLALATTLLLPHADSSAVPEYAVGTVADATVIAPFGFQVPRPSEEVERERQTRAERVPAVLVFDESALDAARSRLLGFGAALDSVRPGDGEEARDSAVLQVQQVAAPRGVALSSDEAEWLLFASRRSALLSAVRRTFERTLPTGVAVGMTIDGDATTVRVQRDGDERSAAADALLGWSDVLATARRLHPDPGSAIADAAYQRVLTAFFIPSLRLDSTTTAQRREAAMATVDPWRFEVRAGEKVVGAHEVVSAEDFAKLEALRENLDARALGRGKVRRFVGGFMMNLSVLAIFVATLAFYRPEVYRAPRSVLVLAAALLLVLLCSAVAIHLAPIPGMLVPVAVASLLISILFDSRLALVTALVLAVLIGMQPELRDSPTLFFVLVGGAAAAFSVHSLQRRTQLLRSMMAVMVAYVFAAVAAGLAFGMPASDIVTAAAFGALNAVGSVALAMALLPPAEELCGVDTYLKLLEWSDLNQPLLRRLAVEAPGTWAHTLSMAALVEAGASAVGANALLARVGTYYHDIGKLDKPQYFVENQARGRNPHDKLKPAASASIIRNHVREGLALADAHKLPRSLRAFIAEHHGTGPIAYFLEKARERDAGVGSTGEYVYPGPVPRSIETAICMIADGVEAATRVLTDPSQERLREVVDTIVRGRVDLGQLREAPITMAQLEIVKEEFVRVLGAMRHGRVEYPGADGVTASGSPTPAIAAPAIPAATA